mgnify:CR=1 FL=1
MSVGQPTMYLAFGDTTDAKDRSAAAKAVTNDYVAGPAFSIVEGQIIQLLAVCLLANSSTELSFMLEVSHGGDQWFPLCAADAMAVSGGEIQSDIYPLVYKLPAADARLRAFSFLAQANRARLLVKGDVAGATVLVKAMV